jgi:hypothetical protein
MGLETVDLEKGGKKGEVSVGMKNTQKLSSKTSSETRLLGCSEQPSKDPFRH